METTNTVDTQNTQVSGVALAGFGFALALLYLILIVALITWGIRLIKKDHIFWGILLIIIGASGLFGGTTYYRNQY